MNTLSEWFHEFNENRISLDVGTVYQSDLKWDKSGNFSDPFQYILARRAKIYWIWSEKNSGLVPFWAHLTQLKPKSDSPGRLMWERCIVSKYR